MSDSEAAQAQAELEKAINSGVLLDDATTDALMAKINGASSNDSDSKSSAPKPSPEKEVSTPLSKTSQPKLEWWALGLIGSLLIISLILNIIILVKEPSSIPLDAKTAKTLQETYLQSVEASKASRKNIDEIKVVSSQINLMQSQLAGIREDRATSIAIAMEKEKALTPEDVGLETVQKGVLSSDKLKEISAQILQVKTRADEMVITLTDVKANQGLIRSDIKLLEEEMVLHRIPNENKPGLKESKEKGGSYSYRNPEDLYQNLRKENLYP
jgi:hypothetical protein